VLERMARVMRRAVCVSAVVESIPDTNIYIYIYIYPCCIN
jgi:hypothetical protein